MSVKIYVNSAEEQEMMGHVLGFFSTAVEDYTDKGNAGVEQDVVEATTAFLENVQVTVGTAGSLDTALMTEIGKAYKEKYVQAKAAGDQEGEFKNFGAMIALKRIMDMVEAPKY